MGSNSKHFKFFEDLIEKKRKEANWAIKNPKKAWYLELIKSIIVTLILCLLVGCGKIDEPANGTLRINVEKVICINHNLYLVINGRNVLVADQYTEIGISCN